MNGESHLTQSLRCAWEKEGQEAEEPLKARKGILNLVINVLEMLVLLPLFQTFRF